MFESCVWKEELRRIAGTVRRVEKPRRWSDRAHGIVERDLMIGFFVLRRLIESKDVSTKISNKQLQVFSLKAKGNPVTYINKHRFWELYDMEHEVPENKSLLYVSNQFIHAYTSFVVRDETRNWSDVLLVSDFDRNDCIWRIPIREIESVFFAASEDYPHTIKASFNTKTGDYDVRTD
jgi:hypothetical protein